VCSWQILFSNSGSRRQVLHDHHWRATVLAAVGGEGLRMMALGDGLDCSTLELLTPAFRCKAPFRRWILRYGRIPWEEESDGGDRDRGTREASC
jgi:hypothetical protein